MSVQILIPAYEPDEKLVKLVRELRMAFLVTVVDDGSGSEYMELFGQLEKYGATVLHHGQNRGKGAALKTGIRHMSEAGAGGIVTADADGQHTVSDITRVALTMEAHPNTLIIGGRDFSCMPVRSRLGNTMSRFFFCLCTGLRVSDTQTGLRGLPACFFERLLALSGERYEYEMNMLLALKEWDVPYLELSIETVYIDDNRSSHFHALRDGWRVFSRVIKYALSSACCAAADLLLYMLFLTTLPAGESYAAARVFSASLNYYLNCRVVFQGRATLQSFAGYALLAAGSMFLGAAATGALSSIGLGSVISKLLADGCLFVLNYIVQKELLFKRRAFHA